MNGSFAHLPCTMSTLPSGEGAIRDHRHAGQQGMYTVPPHKRKTTTAYSKHLETSGTKDTLRGDGYRLQLRNWEPRGDGWLVPGHRGAVPGPWIVFDPPIADRFRVGVDLKA